MLKVILLMNKREDVSDEAFRDYYENQHAPLAREKYLGTFMTDYRRNYLSHRPGPHIEGFSEILESAPDPGFDVITEMWFEDRESLEAMWAMGLQPEVAAEMSGDGDRFRKRESLRFYIVEECS